MNELDRIELEAVGRSVLGAGGRVEEVGGARCIELAALPIPELNRALPLGPDVDVAAIQRWYEGRPHVIGLNPEHASLGAELRNHGYTDGYAWMKFVRPPTPAPEIATALRISETTDAEDFARVSAEGMGAPVELIRPLAGIAGTPGWSVFLAWAGDEPVAAGALFVDGDSAWCGIGSTRPSFRGQGAQRALLAARVERARSAGVSVIVTETGALTDDLPSTSYRNILRTGFREAYLREHLRAPA